jgi:hypothetical protein
MWKKADILLYLKSFRWSGGGRKDVLVWKDEIVD